MRKVYVDMIGDLFHMGHVELLRAARELGDSVVVGVISDELAETYKRRPIMTMAERIAVIEACRYVDEVIPDAPLVVTSEFLRVHGIALVAHGDDISHEVIDEVYGEPRREGKVRILRYTEGISTTELIGRIQALYWLPSPSGQEHGQQREDRCRGDGTVESGGGRSRMRFLLAVVWSFCPGVVDAQTVPCRAAPARPARR
jgi:cytidyltransferase-like protein